MRNLIKIAFIYAFLGAQVVYAQSDDPLQFSFSGYAELDALGYFEQEAEKVNSRFQSLLNLDFSATLNEKAALKANFELRNDLTDRSRDRAYLEELYVDLFTKHADIRLGRQIINWGQSDSYNPLNNFSPTDFSDILDTEEEILPVFATRMKYYIGDLTLDAIFVPVFTPSLLSDINTSRWSPALPNYIPDPTNTESLLRASYQYGSTDLNTSIGDYFQAGLKAAYNLPGWDLALSYYYGLNDIPKYTMQLTPISLEEVAIELIPTYYNWHVVGADFSTSIGQVGIRGEAGLFVSEATDSFDADPTFMQFVIGLDQTFVNVFNENNLVVIVEWIQEVTFDGTEFPTNDFNHIFQRSLFLRLQQSLGNYAELTLQSVYDFKSKSLYLRPMFSYELSEGLQLTVIADILDAQRTSSFFHPYNQNDRLQCKLKYNF